MISIRSNYIHPIQPYFPSCRLIYRIKDGIVSFVHGNDINISSSVGSRVRADLRPSMCIQNPSLMVVNHTFDSTSRNDIDSYFEKVSKLDDSLLFNQENNE